MHTALGASIQSFIVHVHNRSTIHYVLKLKWQLSAKLRTTYERTVISRTNPEIKAKKAAQLKLPTPSTLIYNLKIHNGNLYNTYIASDQIPKKLVIW